MDIAGEKTFKPNASRQAKLKHKNWRGATSPNSLFRFIEMPARR